ncbi:flagellar biosynthesis regulator FlaF [Thalassococcus sp. BH17M4-6]|uniref:flagellar biosynthesis regulator FlaF n=1 Tax=Thalassococcus sp. BH17M4-6 TaxID=3413148 RepID=UPI003BEB7BA8
MNAQSLAQRAYSQSATTTRTDRRIEYELIAQITHRIRAAALKGKRGFPQLVEALSDNRKLWTAFAVDVSDDGNALAPELRAQIFYLAEFVQVHTGKVLTGKARVAPILEVNAAILKGLSGRGAPR